MTIATIVVVDEKKELLSEYVDLYGKDNWALSTYDGNVWLYMLIPEKISSFR